MKKKLFSGALCAGLLFASLSSTLCANVTIDRTRVIYAEGDKESDVRLKNEGADPVVVQSWLDTGTPGASPSDIRVPFVLMPPIARVEAGRSQVVRLVYTGEPLPQNKESVFYLNVLEIPPKPRSDEERNTLQFALRSRIKAFYRPKGLVGEAEQAPSKLTWKLVPIGGGYALEANNPTPYHVSIVRAALQMGDKAIEGGDGMVNPGETQRYPLKDLHQIPAAARVSYSYVDDYGANRDGSAELH